MATVEFILNGKAVICEADGGELLVDTIRNRFKLTGTKKACGTGDCGSCTVLVDGIALRSCITLTGMVQGREVLTIEGLSASPENLHPVQQAFVELNAVQCGYCIPGMVLTACALLQENPNPSEQEVRAAISGNLCRCTGYQKIIQAILLAAARMQRGTFGVERLGAGSQEVPA